MDSTSASRKIMAQGEIIRSLPSGVSDAYRIVRHCPEALFLKQIALEFFDMLILGLIAAAVYRR